jgi:hypothetical protein
MSFLLVRKSAVVLALLLSTLGLGGGAPADNISGAWRMVKYEGPATHGTATGLLLFADNHFSLTYTMDEGGHRWGRAHAGTYRMNRDTLTYHVEWSMQYVSGEPSVAAKASDRDAKFVLAADRLTVTFSNGSVQTFVRDK